MNKHTRPTVMVRTGAIAQPCGHTIERKKRVVYRQGGHAARSQVVDIICPVCNEPARVPRRSCAST